MKTQNPTKMPKDKICVKCGGTDSEWGFCHQCKRCGDCFENKCIPYKEESTEETIRKVKEAIKKIRDDPKEMEKIRKWMEKNKQ